MTKRKAGTPRKKRVPKVRMHVFTDRERQTIDKVAWEIAALPIEQRAARLSAYERAYATMFMRSFPHATHKDLTDSSLAYGTMLVQRIQQLDEATAGPPAGTA